MFVSIGAAALLAGIAVLFARPAEAEQVTTAKAAIAVAGQIPMPAQPGFQLSSTLQSDAH
jgi:hypothetical protein